MMWAVKCLTCLCLLGAFLVNGSAKGSEMLVPGIIADDDALFMMNDRGGIDALSAATGNILWSSNAAAKPLAIQNNLLVCQKNATKAGVLEVVLLQKSSGQEQSQLSISIPSQVWAVVDDQLGRTFVARGGQREGQVFLAWNHRFQKIGGMARAEGPPPPQITNAAHRLNLSTNAYEAAEPSVLDVSLPALPATMQQMFNQGQLVDPYFTGTTFAALASSRPNGQLILLRWNAENGQRLPNVILTSTPTILHLPSVDQKHLLVTQRTAPGTWNEYTWRIYSLDSGEWLGNVQHHVSNSKFIIRGTLLLHDVNAYGRRQDNQWVETPRHIRAVLLNGNEVWSRPIRDTTYRGQVPP